jgi:hypothetical protein
MPIYEYYCPDNHTIYQFYAKTLAQGQTTPMCPDNPGYRMQKLVSAFAISRRGSKDESGEPKPTDDSAAGDDPRMDAAMQAMEKEFADVDENDPRAMARMMRRASDLTGEKIDGQLEEVVRKLEEGADPESLEDQLGPDPANIDTGEDQLGLEEPDYPERADPKEPRHRFRSRRQPARRDPKLYDYP